MTPVGPTLASPAATPISTAAPAKPAGSASKPDAKTAGLHKAAQEFETVLVKQLLAASKPFGKHGESGYGSMAVDAMASGIEAGGGLGLAHAIETAIAASASAQKKPAAK